MTAQLNTWRVKDYYAALGLTRSATQQEIKANFRIAALACHPDKVAEARRAEATLRFQSVAEAFDVLGNEELRRQYNSQNSEAGLSTRCCSFGTAGATDTRGSMDFSKHQRDPQLYSHKPGSRLDPQRETKTTPRQKQQQSRTQQQQSKEQQQRQQRQQQHPGSSSCPKVVSSATPTPSVPSGWNVEQVDGAVIWTRKRPPTGPGAVGDKLQMLVELGYPEADARAALATASSLDAAAALLARQYPDVAGFSESECAGPASKAAICPSCWTLCGTAAKSTSSSGCQVS
eukprot:CAMPEP_0172834918 /NCGR_PEP_ID=MMETSP1075-20121228/25366_1 /TAXON_ID=2916 /ORGANISM="Ceratium fusus, Strain PA161109" /LENGTH=287 /DNA_ID=CAMNT_0013677869 /DNA_START=92 /DNA_END=955 /DNA_ORIENTATION=-